MKRMILSVAAVLLAPLLPLPAPAQLDPPEPYEADDTAPERVRNARISITPLIGWRVPIAQDRREALVVPGRLSPLAVELQTRHTGNGIAGLEAELRLFGPVGIAGALAYSNPDNRILVAETPQGALTQVAFRGASLWFARAGLSFRLPEPVPDRRDYRPAAFLVVGPALVREDYGDASLALPDGRDRIDSWALHMGVMALFPIGAPGVYLRLGVENYATFWNPHDAERRRVEQAMQLQPGTLLNASLGANRTHVVMASFGLSLRL